MMKNPGCHASRSAVASLGRQVPIADRMLPLELLIEVDDAALGGDVSVITSTPTRITIG